jgi:hypothetical protein
MEKVKPTQIAWDFDIDKYHYKQIRLNNLIHNEITQWATE